MFSYCLLGAINMMADSDSNAVEDLDEMIEYVKREVPSASKSVVESIRTSGGMLASRARGRGARITLQTPVSSTHNLGLLPIASPVEK